MASGRSGKYFLLILAILLVGCEARAEPLNGRYTRGITNYQLVVPRRVKDENGFIIFFNGRDHVIELEQNRRLLSPSLMIMMAKEEEYCYFTGHVRGVAGSRVAVSTCNGTVGFIDLPAAGRFFIEPLEIQLSQRDFHIVHEHRGRRPEDFCGTAGLREKTLAPLEYHQQESYFIEVAVAIDEKFVSFHGDNAETYALSVMNMVSAFYSAESVHIIVTEVIRLGHTELSETSAEAERILAAFCRHQARARSRRHDVAILLTREDICVRGECESLGLAHVATACVPSCAISEDNGLELAVTVAHEIGHLLGADHDDDDDGNEGHRVVPSSLRLRVAQLMGKNLGECLRNEPADVSGDGGEQCRRLFGPEATLCEWKRHELCRRLYCRLGDKCLTRKSPPLDGTACGIGRWCVQKKCVAINADDDDEWSPCSRECGGGVQVSPRHCHKFSCDGKRYRMCNTQPCTVNSPSDRDRQCEKFNRHQRRWVGYDVEGDEDRCGLYCISVPGGRVVKFRERVDDGTPCRRGRNDICIEGKCTPVGCDWKLNSTAREDECGVCEGGGSNCRVINGTMTFSLEDDDKSLLLPEDARNIAIKVLSPSKARIVLSNAVTGTKQLEDDSKMEPAENVFIRGPLERELLASVEHRERNSVKIHYHYAVRDDEKTTAQEFSWNFVAHRGQCSVRCGGGTLETAAVCIENLSRAVVPDNFCERRRPKPPSRFEQCNAQPCRCEWQMSRWSSCDGCVQMRNVRCVREQPEWNASPRRVYNEECERAGREPPAVKQCDESAREMRETSVERRSKCLNVLMLKHPSGESDDETDGAETEIEKFAGSDEKLRATSVRPADSTSRPAFFIVHRFHPLVNHHARVEPARGQLESDAIEEIPISSHHLRAYRALDDELVHEEALGVEHAAAIQPPESRKATEQSG